MPLPINVHQLLTGHIGEFLKELELSEGRGTGIPKILGAMRKNGSPSPSFDTDDARISLLVRLPLREDPKAANPKKNGEVGSLAGGVGNIEAEVGNIETEVGNIEAELGNIEAELGNIEAELGHYRGEQVPEELLQEIRSAGRKPGRKLRPVILRLCAWREMRLDDLGKCLAFNPKGLYRNHVKELLKTQFLRLKYPEMPNHPEQAYVTTARGLNSLGNAES